MSYDKTALVRNLVPKSYHFDGYNELKCPNARGQPFFSDNVIPMGDYHLTTHLENSDTMCLNFSNVCPMGNITFLPYRLTLNEYILKLREAIQSGADFITFEVVPRYTKSMSACQHCNARNSDCSQLYKNRPTRVFAAVSFNSKEVKKALAAYYEITKTINGGETMANAKNNKNMFGISMEFGICKDPNIASTLMGVAVKTRYNGSWLIFDRATNTRKNIGNMKMGNFPIFVLPTKDLIPGDLIKLNGQYVYVKSVNNGGTITVIEGATGMVQEIVPETSLLLGAPLYTKVVAMDASTLTDKGSNQNLGGNMLAAMCMMQWAQDKQDEFSLDNITDSSFNGMGQFLPVIMATSGSLGGMFTGGDGSLDISKLFMLGALSGDGDSGDMSQMFVLSHLLGGGNPLFGNVAAPAAGNTTSSDEVVCESCGATYAAGTNFCSKCGSKTKSLAPTCRECGATLNNGAVFCHNCGTKVNLTHCPQCGEELNKDAKFCSKCGHNVTAKPAIAPPAAAPLNDESPVV